MYRSNTCWHSVNDQTVLFQTMQLAYSTAPVEWAKLMKETEAIHWRFLNRHILKSRIKKKYEAIKLSTLKRLTINLGGKWEYTEGTKCMNEFSIHKWLIGWVLWHINFCRLFNANSQFYFKQFSWAWVHSLIVKNISISSYSVYSNIANSV